MDESTGKVAGSNRVLAVFANPWVGIGGSVAGILGLMLAVYFYFQSRSYPELVYYVNPARTVIVKQGTASRLTVSFDGRPLTQDVTASQVAIWNRGPQAIMRQAVLQPITIRTQPRVPILEASIRKKSREVVNLELDPTRFSQGEVSLSWNILEQYDGGVVQVLYAAGPETQIQCLGVIQGQRDIRELRYSKRILSPSQQVKSQLFYRYGLAVIIAITVPVIVFTLIRIFNRKRTEHVIHVETILAILVFVVVVLIVVNLLSVLTTTIPQPPFGFE